MGAIATMGLTRRWLLARLRPAPPAVATWRAVHLDVVFVPEHPVSITAADGGPPQRGDWFFIDAPIYRPTDVGGTAIGVYQCFGAWTAAATANDAPNQRLTAVQFHLADGMVMGLINEGGTTAADPNLRGAVMCGTGAYAGAAGTFSQFAISPKGGVAGTISTAGGTPAPVASAVRSQIDLLVPQRS
jgi:hypothetical protein